MRNRLAALPFALAADSVTRYSPRFAGVAPLTIPVAASSFSSFGSLAAENRIGRSPVQGMRYRNGRPGRAPYTSGPLIFGCGAGLGVRIGCAADAAAAPVNASAASKVSVRMLELTVSRVPRRMWTDHRLARSVMVSLKQECRQTIKVDRLSHLI